MRYNPGLWHRCCSSDGRDEARPFGEGNFFLIRSCILQDRCGKVREYQPSSDYPWFRAMPRSLTWGDLCQQFRGGRTIMYIEVPSA